MALDEDAARLAKGKNLATVVTLMPDGQPQALLTWVDHDGENVLVNTEPQRQRARNVRRDPRVTVLIHSATDHSDWAEVRGHVVRTIDGSEARDHIDELSQRYMGHEFRAPVGPHGRIILVVAPDKVNTPRLLGES
jgi:PPOX class probable F420-dependent enzyme